MQSVRNNLLKILEVAVWEPEWEAGSFGHQSSDFLWNHSTDNDFKEHPTLKNTRVASHQRSFSSCNTRVKTAIPCQWLPWEKVVPWFLTTRMCENKVKRGKLRSGTLLLKYTEEEDLKSEYNVWVGWP